MLQPFHVNIPQSVLDDLKNRIGRTRFPDAIEHSGWAHGASLSYMQELAVYWEHTFNWRDIEAEINAYPNFIASIDGYQVHFLHIKGKGKRSVPLIITHGWPGSFLEMMKLIPLLTTDADLSFDLVIPSMMGYGFSRQINTPGCNSRLMATLWYKLMRMLGYERFGAQGGDFGAGVSTLLAQAYPDHVSGLHLNYIPGSYVPHLPAGETLTEEEIQFERLRSEWYQQEGAYAHVHATKALTLAYALNDSPVGLCAWIVEKFHGWSDCNGDIESVFTKDELLANVTLYWVTATIHSSIRLYYENGRIPFRFTADDFITVPTGIARFPQEIPMPPRRYIERGYNVQHWQAMPAGGHFAAMEQPALLAADLKEFFSKLYP